MSITMHHPTVITVKIVGIEAISNGRSCYQHHDALTDELTTKLGNVSGFPSTATDVPTQQCHTPHAKVAN
jgi:hypothetical protein